MSYIWHNVWSLAFIVGVLGNLVAAVIWAVPALRHLHNKIDRNHREHMEFIRDRIREDHPANIVPDSANGSDDRSTDKIDDKVDQSRNESLGTS